MYYTLYIQTRVGVACHRPSVTTFANEEEQQSRRLQPERVGIHGERRISRFGQLSHQVNK